ncbi:MULTISPECIES: YbdD/YjiX family protein [Brevundimonas]|uniref:YbdD/YjiX family protein n=1 Tax=Brevundimonas pishanensis TaxID=2896315 RepID=UPI0031F40E57
MPDQALTQTLCDCRDTLLRWGKDARRTASLMIGQPDYEAYVAHARANHPEDPPMDRTAFFRLHEARRFGAGGGFKCC